MDNIPPNSDKVKTVKHLSENQKQRVQYQEEQQEKLRETNRQAIKETDPPQKVNRSNADKNKEPRKKVMILGDAIVKGLNEYGLSKQQNVKVQSFSGYTTETMLDIVKPAARRKPDTIIINAGTNDITQDINTMKNIRKIVKSIRDCSENTQVLLSGIISREDRNYNNKISEINMCMASYRERRGLIFTNNNSIDSAVLNRGILHLNKKDYRKFSLNLIEWMKSKYKHKFYSL